MKMMRGVPNLVDVTQSFACFPPGALSAHHKRGDNSTEVICMRAEASIFTFPECTEPSFPGGVVTISIQAADLASTDNAKSCSPICY